MQINVNDIQDGDIVTLRCGGTIEAKNDKPSCGLWFENSHYWYETLDGFVMESRKEHPFDIVEIERHCDICGDWHQIDQIPHACETGDGQ